VFQQLASYLTQYKQVSIPQVGSFELVPKPAMLDVASKRIHPPTYLPQYSHTDLVKDHQLDFLASDLNADREYIKQQLENFGTDLKKRIQQGVFSWKGVGKLEAGDASMVFHPDVIEINGLRALPAEKVLRKNVQHTVRRGEQEVLSSAIPGEGKEIVKKRSAVELIGWGVVIASVVLMIVLFITNSAGVGFSGTKMKVHPSNTSPTHK
jgi:hypothetical protein